MANTDFLLNTDQNVQKQYVNIRSTFLVPGSYSYVDFPIVHNLGYIPSARVWFQPIVGRWYPLALTQLANGSGTDFLQVTGAYSLTTTSLVVSLVNFSGFDLNTDVWARIYLDS